VKAVRPPLLALLAAWVLVVAVVGTVTYLVVDRAGRGLGHAAAARTVAAAPVGSPTETPPTPTTPSPTPSQSPSTRSTPTPSSSPPPPPSSSPPPPRSSSPPPATTRPPSTTESFRTRGGTVVATCVDGGVQLTSITVRDGWRFEDETEDGRLEVKFESGEDDEVDVKIGCADGVPVRLGD
jgi:hypothetical protein